MVQFKDNFHGITGWGREPVEVKSMDEYRRFEPGPVARYTTTGERLGDRVCQPNERGTLIEVHVDGRRFRVNKQWFRLTPDRGVEESDDQQAWTPAQGA